MKPKKDNRPVYRVKTVFHPSETVKIGGFFRDTCLPSDEIIGYGIENVITGDYETYPAKIVYMMKDLGLIEHVDPAYIFIDMVAPKYFEDKEYDLGFLNQYIEKENERPSWEEYFMGIAQMLSSRSTCDRLHVGCVLVKDNHMIGEGYNGSISGHPHCDDVGHLMHEGGCKRTIHAEKNAINMCAKLGISTQGATAYVTHYPCPDCMRELNQAGVKKVIYGSFYKHRFENNFHEGMDLQEFKGRKAIINWEE